MSSILTASRWIHMPPAGGAEDLFAVDAPLGAGVMQVTASNGEWGARRNGLRPLWEHPGGDGFGDLLYGTDPTELDWTAPQNGSAAPLVLFAGVHCIRKYGSTGDLPRVVLRGRLVAPATYTAGLVLVARPTTGSPSSIDYQGAATTTSTSFVSVSISLPLTQASLGRRLIAPRLGSDEPAPAAPETGSDMVCAFYIGVYRSGGVGAHKANVTGLTLSLETP